MVKINKLTIGLTEPNLYLSEKLADMENKAIEHLVLPLRVITVNIINGDVFIYSTKNMDEFQEHFGWDDPKNIQERVIRLKQTIQYGQICIIEINGDSKTIIERQPISA